jgi:hypothetical protein
MTRLGPMVDLDLDLIGLELYMGDLELYGYLEPYG